MKRIGVDGYMILLLCMVVLGAVAPASGVVAEGLKTVTFAAVSLLFFLYGAKLDSRTVLAGLTNWRLQLLVFLATYVLFPLSGLGVAAISGTFLPAKLLAGLIFLAILPSTVQSSIAFTALAGGNVAGAICAASVSNLIGVVLAPALAAILLSQGDGGASFDAVLRLLGQILLPFVLGQVMRPLLKDWLARHRSLTLLVDRGAILLIVYSAFSAGTVAGLWHILPTTALIELIGLVGVWLAVLMGTMMFVGASAGLQREDRVALLFCGSTKSLASGLPIATALFPVDQLAITILPLMVYHLLQLLTCAWMAQRAGSALRTAEG